MTNQDIQKLIQAPKKIDKRTPQKGYKQENNHKRCDLDLIGNTDQNMKFYIFIRQNQLFLENFSIGLSYQNTNIKQTITLVRYNGPHGKIKTKETDHHLEPHIHYITPEEINSNVFNPKEKIIKKTDKYIFFEEALRSFFQDITVKNWENYFPELNQGSFF